MSCDENALMSCGDECSLDDKISLRIWPSTIGGTLVEWTIPPTVPVSSEARYQLQFGRAPSNAADCWENVGPYLVNATQAHDTSNRNVGAERFSYYRILITEGVNTYTSLPHYSDVGGMSKAQQRLYGEIVRREQRRFRDLANPAQVGYLLKLRRHGPPCPTCTDPDTNSRFLEHCPRCFGGGYDRGYYAPIKCFYMDVGNYKRDTKITENMGMVTDGNVSMLRWLNIPQVDPGDIWVDAQTDYRWEIGEITVVTRVGLLPIVCNGVGARLPLNHVAYTIPTTMEV